MVKVLFHAKILDFQSSAPDIWHIRNVIRGFTDLLLNFFGIHFGQTRHNFFKTLRMHNIPRFIFNIFLIIYFKISFLFCALEYVTNKMSVQQLFNYTGYSILYNKIIVWLKHSLILFYQNSKVLFIY